MSDLKTLLKHALQQLLPEAAQQLEVVLQDVPANKPGDYGSPLAFALAKVLQANPAQVAADLAARVQLPAGIARAEAVGPFLNFFVDAPGFVATVADSGFSVSPKNKKVIIEHTSVNPNKEWHVGHIRGALIGDAMGRIYRADGFEVEIQNYIDDTGRQAAESLFAARHYAGENWLEVFERQRATLPEGDLGRRLDHWLGVHYVQLNKDFPEKSAQKQEIQPGISEITHALERGDLRNVIEKIVRAQLETADSLGVEFDLLVWESDVVRAGFVAKALEIFGERLLAPTNGKYAGAKGVDLSPFVPGQEEPFKVLVRGNGTFVYETKDIAYHYWKLGLFEGLEYKAFETQPSGKELWTSAPNGEHQPQGKNFAHANEVINVIDARQTLPQMVVKAGLSLVSDGSYALAHHHLANETVLLEGETMSGRKGTTVPADEVIREAQARALVVTKELNPNLEHPEIVARMIGLGALKFAFLKTDPNRQIDFRWDRALALQGDTAPVVQYAHARIRSIHRKYIASGFSGTPDWTQTGPLELELAKTIAKYPQMLELCIRETSPHPMCAFALELANAFNAYFNHKSSDGKPDTSVIHAPEGLREARLRLVVRVADAIKDVLEVLGIEAPEEM